MLKLTPLLGQILLSVCLLGASGAEERYAVARGINILDPLADEVSKLVARDYPQAETAAFKEVVHFETATRLFTDDVIAKVPEGGKVTREVVRGPGEGGVWCDIEYRNGGLKDRPAYARAEGAVVRKHFVEYTYYVDPPAEPHSHLLVKLRLPLNPGEKEKKFVEDLRSVLKGFKIPRQTDAGTVVIPPGIFKSPLESSSVPAK